MISYEIKLPLIRTETNTQEISMKACLEASSLLASLMKDNNVQEVIVRHKFVIDGKPQEVDAFSVTVDEKMPVISVIPAGIMSEDDNIYYTLFFSCGDDFHISKEIWNYDKERPDEARMGIRFESDTKKVLIITIGDSRVYEI